MKRLICKPEDQLGQNSLSDIQKHAFFEGLDWENIHSMKVPFELILESERNTSYFKPEALFPEESNDSKRFRLVKDHFVNT